MQFYLSCVFQDWKSFTDLLLHEHTKSSKLSDRESTVLTKILVASVKKAVGKLICPAARQAFREKMVITIALLQLTKW